MQNKLKQTSIMPAPHSQQSASSIADDDSDPVDLLAQFLHDGSLSHVVQLLQEPYWKANKLNRSTIDRQAPAEINRSDRNGQLLLTCALKAKSNCYYFFCLLLEKGADPEAVGEDGRQVDWEFVGGEEHEELKLEWENALVAKQKSVAYTMPPGLSHEIEVAARQQLQALKLARNAAVFNSEPSSGWIAPAPAPFKRSHSFTSRELLAQVNRRVKISQLLSNEFSAAPPVPSPAPALPPPAKKPRHIIYTPPPPPPAAVSAPTPVAPLNPTSAIASTAPATTALQPVGRARPGHPTRPSRRQRQAHIVLPLESIPAYIAASTSNGVTAEQMKREKEERDLAALEKRYSSVPANLVPKRNFFVPSAQKPEIVAIDETATLEVSASGKIYTPATLKPFGCTKEGCDKRFKNSNGLKYHRKHGKCSFSGDDKGGSAAGKPFVCHDETCGKRYKNRNGLRYHYENSGAHGVVGSDLLVNNTHPAPQYGNAAEFDIDEDGEGDYDYSQELLSE